MHGVKVYLIALVIFFVVDLLWLGVIAKDFYQEQIGHLMATKVNWLSAIFFYIIYILGLVYFSIMPALNDGNWVLALGNGALFGLVSYATYDLTNLATLRDWPLRMVIYDLIWGTFISAATCLITYGLASSWKTPN